MLDDFIVRAGLVALMAALVAAPLGCFIVWRRLAFFGDSLAHSALLGVAISLLIGTAIPISVLMTCLVIALVLQALLRRGIHPSDTLLALLSQGMLASGLLIVGWKGWRGELIALLLGDILTVSRQELAFVAGGGLIVLGTLAYLWKPLLAASVNFEIAKAEGLRPARSHAIFTILLAVVIAMTMKITGVLLISALLVIPAASARAFARTPFAMVAIAAVIGCTSVVGGLALSFFTDAPSGPAIVAVAFVIFLSTHAVQSFWR